MIRMIRNAIALATVLAFVAPSMAPPRAQADDGPSYALVQALSALRSVGDANFMNVTTWAANPAQLANPFFPWEVAEAQVWALGRRDRDAVLSWLRSNGRGALYGRGATDTMIGPPRPFIDIGYAPSAPASTSDWRKVPFVAGTMGGSSPGHIAIRSGWSMIKRDATSEVHCVSFTNTSPKTATEINFTYEFVDASNNVLTSLNSVRSGTFTPSIEISGPADYGQYLKVQQGQLMPRTLLDNCWSFSSGTAELPLLNARYIEFGVSRVNYSDGSMWTASSNP
ncbi:MAG: hypothetical protein M3T49_09535 [Candidatus Eremiobacteraeota bacterium]|nr:hypothetical protein [Candidatus Eremiobacteraeota bacterium]